MNKRTMSLNQKTSSRRLYLPGAVRPFIPLPNNSLIPPDIDLSRLIPTLDQNAAELVSQQKETLIQRKEVAQKTKDFRKLDDSTKLIEIKTLLKGEGSEPDVFTQKQADHTSLSNVC